MVNINLSEAKDKLSQLVKDTAETTEPVMISVSGRKEAVLISLEEYDSLIETIEILKDRNLLNRIKASKREAKSKKLIDFETFREDV